MAWMLHYCGSKWDSNMLKDMPIGHLITHLVVEPCYYAAELEGSGGLIVATDIWCFVD